MNLTLTRKQSMIELILVATVFTLTMLALKVLKVPLSGPISTFSSLVTLYILYRIKKSDFHTLGSTFPKRKFIALFALLVAIVGTVVLGTIGLDIIKELTGYQITHGSNRFDYIQGNLTALIMSILFIAWFAAAFGEEVLFRGFLISRLNQLFGNTKLSLWLAVMIQAVIFGSLHGSVAANQILAGLFAILYGALFVTLSQRSLWPLIVAHSIPDTLSFIQIYNS